MHRFRVSEVETEARLLDSIAVQDAIAERLKEPTGIEAPVAERTRRQAPRAGLVQSLLVRAGLIRATRPLEAWGCKHALVVPPNRGQPCHPVIEAVHTAFAAHYPLVLSPDDVWLCLAQAFAMHAEVNAEALRSRFVRHGGKLTLKVLRDEFVMGSPDNDWEGCFAEWSNAISAHIGKKRDLIVADFSTTGPVERAASEIVLMSAMKHYFDYLLVTRCGIPEITLLGSVADWKAIRRRAEVLAEFDLADWIHALLPVLDQFVKAAAGAPDREFWSSIYKLHERSGGPFVTGWINVLFPYLDKGDEGGVLRNSAAFAWPNPGAHDLGPTMGSYPRGLSHVALDWDYRGRIFPMTLVAGFFGIAQDRETGAIRPATGWAVRAAADRGLAASSS